MMDFVAWKETSREYLKKGLPPQALLWSGEQSSLFDFNIPDDPKNIVLSPRVPKEFLELAEFAACARDPDRWNLLYRILFRLQHENSKLLNVLVDEDIHRLHLLSKSVRRDIHKLHAFVRFKRQIINEQESYIAWHPAEHFCLKLGTPFFVRRFGDKPWSIFTPDESAHWDLQTLHFGEGMQQHEFEVEDPFDDVWKTYYKSIFNPARLKIKAMKAEMAPKYWSGLPEAEIIHDLIRNTPKRLQDMAEANTFLAKVPATSDWEEIRTAAKNCRACPLADKATQTVFGEGPLQTPLMIVGEQPGNEEDLSGSAFQGPAGQILNQILQELQFNRNKIYVTNAVKHFKWTPSDDGKARIHKKASGQEMHACKPWLEAEIQKVKPTVIVALGVTAGTALWGRLVQIQKERGHWHTQSPFAPFQILSWHPSAILRSFTEEERQIRYQELKEDLRKAIDKAFN